VHQGHGVLLEFLETGAMRGIHIGVIFVTAALLAACARIELPPHLKPLPKDTMMLLGRKGMRPEQPIFVRIFKEESELEIWKQRDDGRFYHFKTYPICNWSGDLGPKIKRGDKQAPEGFYRVTRHQMNPNSNYHLAFNLGYPNAFDRAHGRTGEFLMVHGDCKSAGCYAMTDGLMEEIYALAREAFIGGQEAFEVHAFPFRMTDEKMALHEDSPHYEFWRTLKEAYDFFEETRIPPSIAVCERRYLVNVRFYSPINPARLDPNGYCPPYEKLAPEPYFPSGHMQIAEERVVAPGPKKRTLDSIRNGTASLIMTAAVQQRVESPAPATNSPVASGWRPMSRMLGLAR
jgi:murein L,D-transpeptidase YafK